MLGSPTMTLNESALSDKLVQAAIAYEGKLNWIGSKGEYNPGDNNIADDFMLLFGDSANLIPSNLKQVVAEKYQLIKAKSLKESNYNDNGGIVNNLSMNCWEFCLLALMDADIVSKEQISKITNIINVERENGNSGLSLVHALYQNPVESYKSFNKECLPNKGDILLFFPENNLTEPCHAAMCINNEGGYIELNGDIFQAGNVQRNSFINNPESKYSASKIFYIPASSIQENVVNFIEKYKEGLNTQSKKTPKEILDWLKHSQYRDVLMSKAEQELEDQQDAKMKLINELCGGLVVLKENVNKFLNENKDISLELKEKIVLLDQTIDENMLWFRNVVSEINKFDPEKLKQYIANLSTLYWASKEQDFSISAINGFLIEAQHLDKNTDAIASDKETKPHDQYKDNMQSTLFAPKNTVQETPLIEPKTDEFKL